MEPEAAEGGPEDTEDNLPQRRRDHEAEFAELDLESFQTLVLSEPLW